MCRRARTWGVWRLGRVLARDEQVAAGTMGGVMRWIRTVVGWWNRAMTLLVLVFLNGLFEGVSLTEDRWGWWDLASPATAVVIISVVVVAESRRRARRKREVMPLLSPED